MTPSAVTFVRTAGMLIAGGVLLAACTTGGSSPPLPTTSPETPSVSTSSTAPTQTETPTETPTTSTVPSVSDTTSATPTDTTTPTAPATSATPQTPPCAASQVKLDVLRGGATLGQELAGISVTNSSTTACALQGSPAVQLMRSGKPLGAQIPVGYGGGMILLKSGDEAQAQVTNTTTNCSAPVSDSAQITLPNTSKVFTTKQMQLRACNVKVTAFASE